MSALRFPAGLPAVLVELLFLQVAVIDGVLVPSTLGSGRSRTMSKKVYSPRAGAPGPAAGMLPSEDLSRRPVTSPVAGEYVILWNGVSMIPSPSFSSKESRSASAERLHLRDGNLSPSEGRDLEGPCSAPPRALPSVPGKDALAAACPG